MMPNQVHTSGRPWIRPARKEDLPELETRAAADGHAVIGPSHVLVRRQKDGSEELVGYVSLASVPLLLPWFDTKRCRAGDSVYFINQLENLAAGLMPANDLLCVPVVKGSPFEPHIERLGYMRAGEVVLTFKKLK